MRFLMFIFLLLLLLVFSKISLSQNPDPLSFFPHHLGDYWEYQFYQTDCSSDYSTFQKVVLDSILPDGNHLVRFSPSQIPGSEFLINTSNFEVKVPSFDSSLVYKLNAKLGDSWFLDSENNEKVKVIDVDTTTIFGKISILKVFDFWIYSYPDSLWIVRDYLASDFGFIRQDVEGGCLNGNQSIYCAVIDSVQYGNCIYLSLNDDTFDKIISGFELFQNFPNPFNGTTKINYRLPRSVFVNLSIYDNNGRKIATLINNVQHRGQYDVVWEGKDSHGRVVGSGVYVYTLNAGAFKKSGKMILIK